MKIKTKMDKKGLKKLADNLKKALMELTKSGLVDSKIRSRYAEYLTAYELMKRGYQVQLCNERKDKNADIYIANIDKRVEVKSGKYDEDFWTDASFSNGKQIIENKFDYCVFLTFNSSDESKIDEIFVFNKKELKEVSKPRKRLVKHPETNPCLLLYCKKGLKEYKKYMKSHKYKQLRIEIELHKKTWKYKDRWDKIKSN